MVIVLVAFTLGACDGDRDTASGPSDPPIRTLSDPPTGPYVSVAVDNHFHDIHPVDHKEIDADRAFVVRNEGANLHNVTVQGTDISRDVDPGESVAIRPVGKVGPPGTYNILCKYHADQGMTGEITVVDE